MAALNNQMVKTTWKFGLVRASNDEDIAEFSIWTVFTGVTFDAGDWDTLLADLAAADIDAWQDNYAEGAFSSAVHLRSVREEQYSSALELQNVNETTAGIDWAGDGSGSSLPWETSLCISLYTYTPGGFVPNARRRRGRYYLPPLPANGLNADNSGRLSDGFFTDLQTQTGTFLVDVATGPSSTPLAIRNLAVLSRAANQWYSVTDYVVGNKIDSQRRRQNSEAETRAAHQFTQPT